MMAAAETPFARPFELAFPQQINFFHWKVAAKPYFKI